MHSAADMPIYSQKEATLRKGIAYGLYPAVLSINIGILTAALMLDWDIKMVFKLLGGGNVVVLLAVEFLFPFKSKWRMTKKSFLRDVKWIALSLLTINLVRLFSLSLALDLKKYQAGIFAGMPVVVEALLMALTFEFFQYWLHRYSHEGKGPLGSWLWKVHAAHHLPKEVYLFMHPVFHPLNTLFVQLLLQGSFALMGFRPEAIFIFYVLLNVQELFSHFNVEIKAGFLNYLFIGTELHRFHHSTKLPEAKNYGTFLSFWDIVFGTFYYRPNEVPADLGIENPSAYPTSEEVLKVLRLPF